MTNQSEWQNYAAFQKANLNPTLFRLLLSLFLKKYSLPLYGKVCSLTVVLV
uniref:Uncharacterized protein n=1 Tax=Anguilla anguilla TaxID=7936 RepID=A0A0E9PXM3_ANGAN